MTCLLLTSPFSSLFFFNHQTLTGVDVSAFSKDGSSYSSTSGNANYAALNALKTALAASMPGVRAADIEILSVTSGRRRLDLSSPLHATEDSLAGARAAFDALVLEHVHRGLESAGVGGVGADLEGERDNETLLTAQRQRQHLPSVGRWLQAAAVVTYKVVYLAENYGKDTIATFVLLTSDLQAAQASGSFAKTLTAAAAVYGASALATATVTVQCQNGFCGQVGEPVFGVYTPSPTQQPTMKPSGIFSQQALSSWSPLRYSLVVVGSGIGLVFIALTVFYFRHRLPGVQYKRREAAYKERAALEAKSLGLGGSAPGPGSMSVPGLSRSALPNIITLDDLLDEGHLGGSSHHGVGSDADSISDLSEYSLARSEASQFRVPGSRGGRLAPGGGAGRR